MLAVELGAVPVCELGTDVGSSDVPEDGITGMEEVPGSVVWLAVVGAGVPVVTGEVVFVKGGSGVEREVVTVVPPVPVLRDVVMVEFHPVKVDEVVEFVVPVVSGVELVLTGRVVLVNPEEDGVVTWADEFEPAVLDDTVELEMLVVGGTELVATALVVLVAPEVEGVVTGIVELTLLVVGKTELVITGTVVLVDPELEGVVTGVVELTLLVVGETELEGVVVGATEEVALEAPGVVDTEMGVEVDRLELEPGVVETLVVEFVPVVGETVLLLTAVVVELVAADDVTLELVETVVKFQPLEVDWVVVVEPVVVVELALLAEVKLLEAEVVEFQPEEAEGTIVDDGVVVRELSVELVVLRDEELGLAEVVEFKLAVDETLVLDGLATVTDVELVAVVPERLEDVCTVELKLLVVKLDVEFTLDDIVLTVVEVEIVLAEELVGAGVVVELLAVVVELAVVVMLRLVELGSGRTFPFSYTESLRPAPQYSHCSPPCPGHSMLHSDSLVFSDSPKNSSPQ